jgi:CheY-like chemotaxis protein
MPVLTTVQMLERRTELPADLHEILAMMRRNLELESRLIDDLLDLNRIRQGKLMLAYANVDLHSKVRHVVELCRNEMAEKRQNLKLDLAATESHVAADSARIQQVLWNLLSNAVKFTPLEGTITVRTCNGARSAASCTGDCGGGKPTCRRCSPTMPEGQFVGIHVTDTGVGIAPEAIHSLFDAFGRGEREGRHSNSKGIGLAVTRAVVELHGGQLIVHSHGRGKGATFSVVLPLRSVCMLPAEHARTGRPAQAAIGGKRVLLVEDHPDTAKALSRLLSDSGMKVTVASCVSEAKVACDCGEFDLLISDIGLPDGTGMDVMRHVRHKAPIPAIALSGYGMDDDIRRSRDAGFSDHMVKPINISQLQQTIRRLLTVC